MRNDNIPIHSAALSYYAILGLPGVLIIFLVITDYIIRRSGSLVQILDLINQVLGSSVASFLRQIITNINLDVAMSPYATFTLLVLIYSSVNALQQVESTLNHIWRIEAPPITLKSFTIDNLIKLVILFLGGVVIILTVVINSFLNHLIISLNIYVSIFFVDIILSYIILFISFNILYMKLPSKDIPLKDTWKGSFLSSMLFLGAQLGISAYFSTFRIGFVYGSASAMVILLLWLYVVALIFYLGSAFNFVIKKE